MSTEALDQQLTETIKILQTSIIDSVSYVQAQLPDLVNQILWWNFTTSLLSMMVFVIGISSMVYFNYKQYKWFKTQNLDEYDKHTLINLNIFQLIPFIFLLLFISITWLQILIAPKLFLIEYVSKLLK